MGTEGPGPHPCRLRVASASHWVGLSLGEVKQVRQVGPRAVLHPSQGRSYGFTEASVLCLTCLSLLFFVIQDGGSALAQRG